MPDVHYTFPPSRRLTKASQFQRVYAANVRVNAGPLLVYGQPNNLGHARLGLAIARRVGKAVVRNRLKRMLREAFRLKQHELPAYDLLVSARNHKPLSLDDYQALLVQAACQLEVKCEKKAARSTASAPGDAPPASPPGR